MHEACADVDMRELVAGSMDVSVGTVEIKVADRHAQSIAQGGDKCVIVHGLSLVTPTHVVGE